MKNQFIIYISLILATHQAVAGCMAPYGKYKPKEGETKLIINTDQTIKLFNKDELLYKGVFDNFNKLKGTEYHNYENAILIKPTKKEQSYISFHISDDCELIKVGVNRRYLERFGGTPPKLNAKIFWKND